MGHPVLLVVYSLLLKMTADGFNLNYNEAVSATSKHFRTCQVCLGKSQRELSCGVQRAQNDLQ